MSGRASFRSPRRRSWLATLSSSARRSATTRAWSLRVEQCAPSMFGPARRSGRGTRFRGIRATRRRRLGVRGTRTSGTRMFGRRCRWIEKRGLVFLPTSSASPDFFGGLRPGDNKHANSVVALKAETGELVWAFQTVHHDVWDYDNPAQPTLATIDYEGRPARCRDPADEAGLLVRARSRHGRAGVSGRGAPCAARRSAGEVLSPTQPYPTLFPRSRRRRFRRMTRTASRRGIVRLAANDCRTRNEGLYTPPSEKGTLMFPFTGGGMNWGGVAFDPVKQVRLCEHVADAAPDHAVSGGRVRQVGREISGPRSVAAE